MLFRSWIASGNYGFFYFNTDRVETLVGPDLRRGDELMFCVQKSGWSGSAATPCCTSKCTFALTTVMNGG